MSLEQTTYDNSEEAYKALLKGAKRIGDSRLAFRKMLEEYVPLSGYTIPNSARILNLGCGRCEEALVLSGYFGSKPFGFDSKSVKVVGIDIDPKKIEKSEQLYESIDSNNKIIKFVKNSNYTFIEGDARKLRRLVNGEFDIIVARHPNIAEKEDMWRNVFVESRKLIKSCGLFIGTSYSNIEHQMFEEQVQKAGYKILLSKENSHATPISRYLDMAIDKRILLAKRNWPL